mmetsp:Transcript_24792/g.50931  ORF Transcript_24792/g.50931 Transcript_24792/m.50931 type:complete len:379 (-) Transcript_24792:159-1295(-)
MTITTATQNFWQQVFLARGAGAMVGSFSAGKLYSWFHGNYVLVIALLWVSTVLMLLSWCTQTWYLHVLFAMLGLGTAVVDTGCQIMTRKAHGRGAGPWLGANTVSFGIAGAVVPLMEIWTNSLLVQFSILSTCGLLTAIAIILIPVPTYLGQSMDKKLGKTVRAAAGSSYWVESCFACAVFCLIGGKVTFSSYLKDYIAATFDIAENHKSLALAMLWAAITVGRLFGLHDQINVESKGQLYNHLYLWLVVGALGSLILMFCLRSNVAAWFGIIMYGFGNGPCVGYCYDINNRITVPSEFGMAVVMFGLNFGASIVPYVTAVLWEYTGHAFYLPLITFLTMVLPVLFVRLTKHFQKEEVGFMYAIGPASASSKSKDTSS